MFEWTGVNVQILRDLWGEHSAGYIAGVIGAPSRNSVLGKAHRLGLSQKRSGPALEPFLRAERPMTPLCARLIINAPEKDWPMAIKAAKTFLDGPESDKAIMAYAHGPKFLVVKNKSSISVFAENVA